MARWVPWAIACAIAGAPACKGKAPPAQHDDQPPAPPIVHDAPPPTPAPDAWTTCQAALQAVPKLPVTKQVEALLTGCQPHGPWTPLLTWATPTEDGGPTRKAIEELMVASNAYCDANTKMRFLSALDDNRGRANRAPWRVLGDFCKESVSAVPDGRFMSAPFFALDRIARDVAARPDGAKLLAPIELVMPAVSVSGAGLALPTSAVTKPSTAPSQLTVSLDELRFGSLARGRLGAAGVTVTGDLYPGALTTARALAATLDKLPQPVLLFAPKKMPATRIAEVLVAAGRRPLQLALAANTRIEGWDLYGAAPTELVGAVDPEAPRPATPPAVYLLLDTSTDAVIKEIAAAPATAFAAPPTIVVSPKTTVEALASVLGALGYKDVKRAVVTANRPNP